MISVKLKEKPRGQIFTPRPIADLMVKKLFKQRAPKPKDVLLDPGCGYGVFIESVLVWCKAREVEPPQIVGVELDDRLVRACRRKFHNFRGVSIIHDDFLTGDFGQFDFVIGNPPYVRLEELSEKERRLYRRVYETAVGRFDLYMLFFEKAIKSLKDGGRLVFITPEKFEYTLSSAPLRRLLTKFHVEEIHHIKEDVFGKLITYPTITTINKTSDGSTKVVRRDGSSFFVKLPKDGSRWISIVRGDFEKKKAELTLEDITRCVSCGVATGKDKVFVVPKNWVPKELSKLAYPTVSGRNLTSKGIQISHVLIIPYDEKGHLLPRDKLENFIRWVGKNINELKTRYCVRKGKRKWYEFHEIPPMENLLRPKILCKDISEEPSFWLDEKGTIVPRHSVYYIVPKDPSILRQLYEYLNSEEAKMWLVAHAQRAANGFIRLQSSVLKKLPIPPELLDRRKGLNYTASSSM